MKYSRQLYLEQPAIVADGKEVGLQRRGPLEQMSTALSLVSVQLVFFFLVFCLGV